MVREPRRHTQAPGQQENQLQVFAREKDLDKAAGLLGIYSKLNL